MVCLLLWAKPRGAEAPPYPSGRIEQFLNPSKRQQKRRSRRCARSTPPTARTANGASSFSSTSFPYWYWPLPRAVVPNRCWPLAPAACCYQNWKKKRHRSLAQAAELWLPAASRSSFQELCHCLRPRWVSHSRLRPRQLRRVQSSG